jgi:hypothetical protein
MGRIYAKPWNTRSTLNCRTGEAVIIYIYTALACTGSWSIEILTTYRSAVLATKLGTLYTFVYRGLECPSALAGPSTDDTGIVAPFTPDWGAATLCIILAARWHGYIDKAKSNCYFCEDGSFLHY